MKRTLAFFLTLALILSCCPVLSLQARAEEEDEEEEELEYFFENGLQYYIEDGEAYFCGCDEDVSGSIIIPDTAGGYPVTGIAFETFCYSEGITSVTIPASVTELGPWALSGCTDMTGIWVAKDNPAFCNDASGVLYNKDMTHLLQAPGGLSGSYTIPDGVTNISMSAFWNCVNLTSVSIPDSVLFIEGDAMNGSAFDDCENLAFNVYQDVNYLGNSENPYYAMIGSDNYDLTQIIAHPDTVVIAEAAFSYWDEFESVSFGDKVTHIGDEAFMFSLIQSLSIPDSLQYVGVDAFYDAIYFESFNTYDNANYLGNSTNPYVLLYSAASDSITSCNVHKDTKLIHSYAFSYGLETDPCCDLTSVTIPEGVRSIGTCAFYGCSSLSEITIPGTVKTVGDWAFEGCTSLTSVTVSKGVECINYGAFMNCSALKNVSLPEGVALGEYLFQDCDSLTQITLPADLTAISRGLFYSCDALTQVTIPEGIITVGFGAFTSCVNLRKLALPGSITVIDDYAFEYAGLTELSIPESVTSIGYGAFAFCDSLSGITIPDSVTTLGSCTFYECSDLAELTIGSGITEITAGAFQGCTAMKKVTIGCNVTTISEDAFLYCDGLTDVYYAGTEEQWAAITIEIGNDGLTKATMRYNSAPPVVAGDLDGDETVSVDDAIYLLQHVLMPGLFPITQDTDYNSNGQTDVDDAIYLLQHVLMPGLFPLN